MTPKVTPKYDPQFADLETIPHVYMVALIRSTPEGGPWRVVSGIDGSHMDFVDTLPFIEDAMAGRDHGKFIAEKTPTGWNILEAVPEVLQ